jgi:hypothetical protein
MKKTFKEILHEKHPKTFNALYANQVIELMQYVREQTLKECAEKAKMSQFRPFTERDEGLIERYKTLTVDISIDKNTILSLDKNSIEVQP